jgi:hypothetical protein
VVIRAIFYPLSSIFGCGGPSVVMQVAVRDLPAIQNTILLMPDSARTLKRKILDVKQSGCLLLAGWFGLVLRSARWSHER